MTAPAPARGRFILSRALRRGDGYIRAMTLMRSPLIGLLLALVMTLTSQGMAVARAMPGPSGLIELCNSTGPVMVAVDDNGQPVGPAHICPDFAAHAFDIGGGMAAISAVVRALRVLHVTSMSSQGQSRTSPAPQARGPPVFV